MGRLNCFKEWGFCGSFSCLLRITPVACTEFLEKHRSSFTSDNVSLSSSEGGQEKEDRGGGLKMVVREIPLGSGAREEGLPDASCHA